ncbi:claudin-34 [Aulostomus maculatus]
MMYLAHTAHWQFLGLVAGCLAWILTMTTAGINEWRVWHVADMSVITSGVAWVGIWRTCFYSHALPNIENCQSISILDDFVPTEMIVAQVLMMLAGICGLAGNISGSVAVRMAYFSVDGRKNIRLVFVLAGTLYVLTAVLALVPLVWNMRSVLNNNTIDFPPEFHLPPAPIRQQVGSAIGVGIFASILMLISGLLFFCYQYVWEALSPEAPRDALHGPQTETSQPDKRGVENPAFDNQGVP